MFSLTTLILTAIFTLSAGIVIGILFDTNVLSKQKNLSKDKEIQDAKDELKAYQDSVAKHFSETSEKVGEFTQSYLALHQQLSQGAMKLTNEEVSQQMLAASRQENALPKADISTEKNIPSENLETPESDIEKQTEAASTTENLNIDDIEEKLTQGGSNEQQTENTKESTVDTAQSTPSDDTAVEPISEHKPGHVESSTEEKQHEPG